MRNIPFSLVWIIGGEKRAWALGITSRNSGSFGALFGVSGDGGGVIGILGS